ncbi:FAD-dependent oxidoreductase [Natronoarchaeum philippinense]|nr:FAD-dependent oxidoreductase [Natronoarchaeum philippinense]
MIGVVGGGIAGLVAARELRERGREVQVFEAGNALGGLAATTPTAGDPVGRVPLTLSADDDAVADLADELGIADRLKSRDIRRGQYVDGVAHSRTRLSEKLAFPRLSLQDKLFERLLAGGVSLGPVGPPTDALDAPETYDDVPALAFVDDHATASVREQVVEPHLRAAFGERAEVISAAWLLGDLARRRADSNRSTDSIVYPEGGFATLGDALIAGVGRENVSLGARVVGLETTGGDDAAAPAASDGEGDETGFVWNDGDAEADGGDATVEAVDATATESDQRVERLLVERDGERTAVDVDAVVFATPPRALERATGYEWTGETRSLVSVLFGLSASLLDTYELTVADDAPFGRLVEHTNAVDPAAYDGDHLLYAVAPVADQRDERWQQDDDTVARRWGDSLEALFPDFDRQTIQWSTVTRVRDAGPVYEIGSRETVIEHDLADTVAKGCFYAGTASEAQYPNWTVDGAVRAGRRCATLAAVPKSDRK